MRLTLALFKRKMPNGRIWTGKHRFGHQIYAVNIERFVRKLDIEDNNMLLLRHPYLTLEQDRGHALALKKQEVWLNDKKLEKASKKVKLSTRFEDKLGHLCVADSWEL